MAVALGGALVAAGWLDIRSYVLHRHRSRPIFDLVQAPAGDRFGDNEFFRETDSVVSLNNMGSLEWDVDETGARIPFRQMYGPDSGMEIWSSRHQARIDYRIGNGLDDQTITVTFNGQMLEQIHAGPGVIARQYDVTLRPGSNLLNFAFSRYLGHGAPGVPADPRPIACRLKTLDFSSL